MNYIKHKVDGQHWLYCTTKLQHTVPIWDQGPWCNISHCFVAVGVLPEIPGIDTSKLLRNEANTWSLPCVFGKQGVVWPEEEEEEEEEQQQQQQKQQQQQQQQQKQQQQTQKQKHQQAQPQPQQEMTRTTIDDKKKKKKEKKKKKNKNHNDANTLHHHQQQQPIKAHIICGHHYVYSVVALYTFSMDRDTVDGTQEGRQ